MIEAELKARVMDVGAVKSWLRARAEEEKAVYHDTYYDWPDNRLDAAGREIRLRTISSASETKRLLTYKQPPVEIESGSKPEFEISVSDPALFEALFKDLGLVEFVSFTKNCHNYRFDYEGRAMLATLATVAELNSTFLEIETLVDIEDLSGAISSVRGALEELDLASSIINTDYTTAIRNARLTLVVTRHR